MSPRETRAESWRGAAGSVGTWTVTRPALAGTLASTLQVVVGR
jgi:hypothetical protein